jgi:hypothetical protein
MQLTEAHGQDEDCPTPRGRNTQNVHLPLRLLQFGYGERGRVKLPDGVWGSVHQSSRHDLARRDLAGRSRNATGNVTPQRER